jgi:hypothetical protein
MSWQRLLRHKGRMRWQKTRQQMSKPHQQTRLGGWTKTRPVSLGLLPSGSDPIGE